MSLSHLETDLMTHVSAIRARLRGHWQHKSIVLFHKACDALLAELLPLPRAGASIQRDDAGAPDPRRSDPVTFCQREGLDGRGDGIDIVIARIGR